MGLFSGLKKLVGKVAKAGLSVVTRGASDKVIGVAKGLFAGKPKQARATMPARATAKEQALIAKLTPPKPRVSITEGRMVEGWSFGSPKRSMRRATKGRRKAAMSVPKRAGSPAKPRSGRKPPSGGLDLKAIGVLYRQQGKPGKWIDFVKANSHIRK